jgi:hypothetical protein
LVDTVGLFSGSLAQDSKGLATESSAPDELTVQ